MQENRSSDVEYDIHVEHISDNHHRRLISTAKDHLVVNLPGLSDSKIIHYAGHLNLKDPKAGALFYWFFEAEEVSPATAPLLIWLNGGPVLSKFLHGCLVSLSFSPNLLSLGMLQHGWFIPGAGTFQNQWTQY